MKQLKVRIPRKKMIDILCTLGFILLTVSIFIPQHSLPDENDSEPKKLQNEVVQIWGWDDSITKSFDLFYQHYPNITLEFIPTKIKNYVEKIKVSLATNNEIPDICLLENDYRGQLMTLDIWENLESHPYNLNPDKILDYILPNVTNSKGEIIAVPYDIAIAGMAYRRSLTKQFFGTDDEKKLHTLFYDWNSIIEKGKELKSKEEMETFLFASLADAAVILLNQTTEPYILNEKLNHPERFLQSFYILTQLRDEHLVDTLKQWSPTWYNSFTEERYFFYPCAAWSYIQWFLLSEEGAFFNKDELSGIFIHYQDVYTNPIYTSMYNECFGQQDIGHFFFEDIFPSIQVRPIGKYDRIINDTFLLMSIALIEKPTMTANEAMTIFIHKLQDRIPELEVDLTNFN